MSENRVRRMRIEPDGFDEQAARIFESTPIEVNDRESIQRIEVLGIAAQNFGIHARGFGEIAQLMRAARILQQRLAHDGGVPVTENVAGCKPRWVRSHIMV